MKVHTLCLSLAALLTCSLALTQQQKEKLNKINPSCIQETGISDEARASVHKNEWGDYAKIKPFMFCMFKKLQLINENGDLDSEKWKTLAKAAADSEDDANSAHEKCVVKKDSPEETAYNVIKCFHLNLERFSPVL